MDKLHGYDPADRERIKRLACELIEGQIVNGTLACTDEAIRAAMPQAVQDAKQLVNAANEYLCG